MGARDNLFRSSGARRRRRRRKSIHDVIATPTEVLEERLVLDVSAPALLQIFDSSYDNIEDRSADIFAAGYGGVWIPPTGRADSGNQSVGYDVFDRFDLGVAGAPTLYGTETGLKTSIDVLHNAGLQVYVDFILNHNGFSDLGNQAFVDAGGYPGFAITLNPGNNVHGIDDIDGDFNSIFEGGDHDGRLAGLIDIDQQKNYQFIRSPVDPADPLNIPAGTVNNVADPNNARFYPDRDLDPIMLFNPLTGQGDIPVYPFNTNDPLQGDAVTENALGLMMRNAQWLVQEIGVDGFRLDAAKHFPNFVLEFFDQAVYRSNQRLQLDGSPQHVFSFSEVFDGDKSFQQTKIRKDIDLGDPGRIGGNRDVLDFPLNFALRDNLTGNGFVNDWRNIKNASQDVQDDGFANNGSQAVAFVNSHDEHGPELSSVAHAFVLMRPGNAVVYFNAEEFGQGRDFPKDGRGDALGGQFGNAIPTLVNIRNSHGRGDYIDRTPGGDEKEMLIFERSASAVTILSNRTDGGFDERTIQTNFLPGTPLIELTGNAANPVIDPFNDFPEVVTVNGDGTINVRVPRNRAPGTDVLHNSGYLIYGVSGQQGTLSLTNVAATLGPDTPTPETNGTSRVNGIDVINVDTFDVTLTTTAVNHLGSIRDTFADGDNALLKIDSGIDINGNGAVDFTEVGNTSYGFENFVTHKQPGFFESDRNGLYRQTIDATQLSEGQHFIEAIGYRHREPGEGDAVYTSFKQTIYVDRLVPVSEVASFDPLTNGVNENRQLRVRSTDLTADNVHVFLDLPASLTDAEVIAMLDGNSQTQKLDRDLFANDFNGVKSGNHVATIVTFEVTGNVNVQRVGGLFVSSILGAGLGDMDFDGDHDADDFAIFETVIQSNGGQFNPAGDFNADGLITVADLPLYHQQILGFGLGPAEMDAFDVMVINVAPLDYGDAPANYPTLQADGGAHHILTVGPFLGTNADADVDGQPTAGSDGDDADGSDDDDGVTVPVEIMIGQTVSLPVVASADGILNAFIDLNADGDFSDPNEQFATDMPLVSGSNAVPLTIPATNMPADTVVRFRFGSYTDVGPTGLASDGEVEDYAVELIGELQLAIDETSIAENGGFATGTITRSGNTTGDLVIDVSSLLGDVTFEEIVEPAVRILSGPTDASFVDLGLDPVSGEVGIVGRIDDGSSVGIASLFELFGDRSTFATSSLVGLGPDTIVLGIASDATRVAGVSKSTGSTSVGEGTTWLRHAADSPTGVGFVDGVAPTTPAVGAWADGVVGFFNGGDGGYRWTSSTGLEVLAGNDISSADAEGVSADGNRIVGFSTLRIGNGGATEWVNDQIIPLSEPFQFQSKADAISPNGNVVGGMTFEFQLSTLSFIQHPAVWDANRDLILLKDNSDAPFQGRVWDVSDSGYAVGKTIDDRGFIWHPSFDGVQSPFHGPQIFEDWLVAISGGQALPTASTEVVAIAEDTTNGMLLFAVEGTDEAYFVQASVPGIMQTDTITIPSGQTSTTFRINAVDNFLLDGNRTETVSVVATGYASTADTLGIIDDDNAGFHFREFGPDTTVNESGTTDIFDIVLDAQPASDVTITVSSGDTGEVTVDKATLTFTPENWNVGQVVTVTGVDDSVNDDDQVTPITLSIDAANGDDAFDLLPDQTVQVTTVDDEFVDLVGTKFNAVSDHVLLGQTDVDFEIANTSSFGTGPFSTHIVWSPNGVVGDADDVVVAGSVETFAGVTAGSSVSHTQSIQLDQATLYARAAASDIAGLPPGTVSMESSQLFLVIDINDEVAESSETNNFGQGHLVDSDDVTYFPWDVDSNGTVTPREALSTIQAINTADPTHDLDGNGIVTPLEALAVLQRIGYVRNESVIGDAPATGLTEGSLIASSSFAAASATVMQQPLDDDDDESDLFAVDAETIAPVQVASAEDLSDLDAEFTAATEWLSVI